MTQKEVTSIQTTLTQEKPSEKRRDSQSSMIDLLKSMNEEIKKTWGLLKLKRRSAFPKRDLLIDLIRQ